MDTIKIGKLNRAIEKDAVKIDKEARSIEFSFSSEAPVERWFGNEILSHEKGAFNFNRLNDGGQLLFNHKMDEYIGVIEKAWVGDDKRAYVKARFSKNTKAQEILDDVEDGILRNVSFGYMIHEIEQTKSSGDVKTYTATKWEAYEVSIVTVPADPTVGIGRSIDDESTQEVRVINRDLDTNTNIVAENAIEPQREKMENIQVVDHSAAIKAERERQAGIRALGNKLGMKELAEEMANGEVSLDNARAAFLEKMGAKQVSASDAVPTIGMTERDLSKYSIVRAINALANPQDRDVQKAAGFEMELSRAFADKMKKQSRGIMIPADVLMSGLSRDLTVGTSTAGGNLVATNLLSDSFIDLLRKKSVVQQAGATVLNGLVGNLAIPRQSGGATVYWLAESGAPTEGAMTFDQVALSPKTLGAYLDMSRKLLIQSSVDIEAMVRKDIATGIALEIDRAALYGSGSSNQPTGVKNVSGINTKDFAANTPTFAEIIALETEIAADDADVAGMKYLINASMRGALKGAEISSGYPKFIFEGGSMNGYPALTSNQIASNDVWFGNWADLVLGFWSGLDLLVDPYTQATSGTVRIVAHQDVDVAVRHPESFCRGNNTL